MNLFINRNRLTDLDNKFMVVRGENWGKRKRIVKRQTGTHYCILDNQQDNLICYCIAEEILLNVMWQSRWEWSVDGERMNRCLYMAESVCCLSEIITTLLTSYIPI